MAFTGSWADRVTSNPEQYAEDCRRYIEGEMNPVEVADFLKDQPAPQSEHLVKCRIAQVEVLEAQKRDKVRRDLIKERTEPCPDDHNPQTWYARRTNLLLAAILERLP